jgi:hypothetical protein
MNPDRMRAEADAQYKKLEEGPLGLDFFHAGYVWEQTAEICERLDGLSRAAQETRAALTDIKLSLRRIADALEENRS